jgi:acyl-CoA synthetase (AMP-forming)/AMP-acid ligase II
MSIINDLQALAGLGRALPSLSRWARETPTTILEARARALPNYPALAFEKKRYSWHEVDAHANQWAFVLSTMGVGSGDVIALLMDNRPDFLFALHGLGKLGASAALINTQLSGRPLAHAINIGKAGKVICGAEHLKALHEVLPELNTLDADQPLLVHAEHTDPQPGIPGEWLNTHLATAPLQRPRTLGTRKSQDLFAYIYTSGTTGLPKAAIISNLRALGTGTLAAQLMLEIRPGDVVYVPLPLYHSNALLLGWCAALSSGACIALRRKFSARHFWHDVRTFGASRFIYIGELCRYLLNTPPSPGERSHNLKYAVGNGLRPDIWTAFQQRFGVPTIREFYGSTEGTGGLINRQGKPGMVGRLQVGQALVRCDQETGTPIRNHRGHCQPVETGEVGLLLVPIWPVVGFDGYLDRQATGDKVMVDVMRRGDRFFNTGDLFQRHKHNWLSFSDRVGDNFRWKGENISTNELAEVCNNAPGVVESNIYGVRVSGADGRAGMAALCINDAFNITTFARHVMTHLRGYQRPLFLRLLTSKMETTGTLKHQKVKYREEGFDPARTADKLYYFDDDHYHRLDAATFARIESGDIRIG